MNDSNIKTAVVKLSQEEAAGGRIFAERNILHGRVNEKQWGDLGDVYIAGDGEFLVAYTEPVKNAVSRGRLVLVEDDEKKVELEDISITDAALELAEENDLDLVQIQPTGRGGTQITKGDVERFIKASKD